MRMPKKMSAGKSVSSELSKPAGRGGYAEHANGKMKKGKKPMKKGYK